jgi:hypothetical protein
LPDELNECNMKEPPKPDVTNVEPLVPAVPEVQTVVLIVASGVDGGQLGPTVQWANDPTDEALHVVERESTILTTPIRAQIPPPFAALQ